MAHGPRLVPFPVPTGTVRSESPYGDFASLVKAVGRRHDRAAALSRDEARRLMGGILDGTVSDLALGAFCIAMRHKGETADEFAGFLDAIHARIARADTGGAPTVVLPCYNGARKMPVLTPLLATLLARAGAAVVMHGMATESRATTSETVLALLAASVPEIAAESLRAATPREDTRKAAPLRVCAGHVTWIDTARLHPGLVRLLAVRMQTGLRNAGHSLVKMLNPCSHPALIVSCYTHTEYIDPVADALALTGQPAMLLRGSEGEPVADARRMPAMDLLMDGRLTRVEEPSEASRAEPEGMPDVDASSTAAYVQAVLDGALPVPEPIRRQTGHLLQALGLTRRAEA